MRWAKPSLSEVYPPCVGMLGARHPELMRAPGYPQPRPALIRTAAFSSALMCNGEDWYKMSTVTGSERGERSGMVVCDIPPMSIFTLLTRDYQGDYLQ